METADVIVALPLCSSTACGVPRNKIFPPVDDCNDDVPSTVTPTVHEAGPNTRLSSVVVTDVFTTDTVLVPDNGPINETPNPEDVNVVSTSDSAQSEQAAA